MPLNRRGRRIKQKMIRQYGEKKGEQVFYASERSGKLKNVTDGKGRRRRK